MAASSGVAFSYVRELLRSYGLQELEQWAYQQFVEGKTADEISIEIESQPAFKRKFAAIFARRERGLPPVSALEIVDYRRRALALERFYDLPEGMISSDTATNDAVAGDISFEELTNRVQVGARIAYNSPPEVKAWLQSTYGIGEGGLIAYFTDADLAMPLLERQATSAIVAGAASRQGFGTLSREEAEGLAGAGVDPNQADRAFGVLGQAGQITGAIAGDVDPGMDRRAQLALVGGSAVEQAEFERRRRRRTAVNEEGGGYAGRGLVSGTDR
jgi:hypothetical protein